MTSREFGEWFTYASAAFPALHRLFVPGEEETKRRAKQWTAAFGSLSVDAAKAAIDAMLAGRADPPKFDWAELPAKVLAYCGEQANAELAANFKSYHEDGPRYRCLHCRDSISGFLTIWNPKFIEACDEALLTAENLKDVQDIYREWRDKDRWENKYRTFGVVCCCDSPAARLKRERAKEQQRTIGIFNPKRYHVEGSLADLKEYLSDSSRYEWEYSNPQTAEGRQ